jgi:serine/threonine protein kinase
VEDLFDDGTLQQPPVQLLTAGKGQEELQGEGAIPAVAAAACDAESLDGGLLQIEEEIDEVVVTTPGFDSVRLLHRIGQGTYGSVYMGRLLKQATGSSAAAADTMQDQAGSSPSGASGSRHDGPLVAVKAFPSCSQPPAAEGCICGPCLSFRRERNSLLLLLDQPGVVQLLATGTVKHLEPWEAACGGSSDNSMQPQPPPQQQQQLSCRKALVMELAEGTLEDKKQRSEQEASALMLPLVTAMTVMHSGTLGDDCNSKVVHRDMKPSNILVVQGVPKICDFSNCALFIGHGSKPQMMYTIAGTKLYMAPEMLDPVKGYSCDVDCYSLGLVAVNLLLGGSAALYERALRHTTRTMEGWVYDFCQGWELPLEQGVSSQARDVVRCCCLQRQRAQQLLQHDWLHAARVAARASELGPDGS